MHYAIPFVTGHPLIWGSHKWGLFSVVKLQWLIKQANSMLAMHVSVVSIEGEKCDTSLRIVLNWYKHENWPNKLVWLNWDNSVYRLPKSEAILVNYWKLLSQSYFHHPTQKVVPAAALMQLNHLEQFWLASLPHTVDSYNSCYPLYLNRNEYLPILK